MLRQNFRIRYGEPNPKHREYARHVLSVTLLHGMGGDDESAWNTEISKQTKQNLIKKANALLDMCNSDWKSTCIVHCCTFGCCSSPEDSHSLLATCITFERVPTPEFTADFLFHSLIL